MMKKSRSSNRKMTKLSLSRLHELLDGVPEPICVSDPVTCRIFFANKKSRELAGPNVSCRRCVSRPRSGEGRKKLFEARLSALNKYGQRLNTVKSLEEIYKITLDAMQKTLGFEYASILLVGRKELRLVAQRGYSKQLSLSLLLSGERGITVRTARSGRPVLVPDIRKEETYVLGKPGMLSELAVPIRTGKTVLGVLNVESRNVSAFSRNDARLLEILASITAIAMSHLERQEQLGRLSTRLQDLMKSATEIMHCRRMHQRLKVIVKTIRRSGWRRVVISLRDENLEGTDLVTSGLNRDEIKILVARKAPGKVWGERLGENFERFRIGEFYYLPWNDQWVRRHVHGVPPKTPLDEATTYAGVPSRLSPEEMVDWHPQDMLYAPLRTPGGRIVGILSMDDPLDGRRPTNESLSVLEIFLHQAAMIIENAQLIESLRGARKQLESYAGLLEQKVEERTRELRDSQARLLKAQRLAVIGELAGMVGHDLRNPLTSIAGAAYYLGKHVGQRKRRVQEMVGLIERNITYSNKIINDLLDYSKEMKMDSVETDPHSLAAETLMMIDTPEGIEIVNLTTRQPKLKVDAAKMKRAFVNIIRNAFDAMPQGGTLTVRSRKSKENAEFEFSDNGVGMTEETVRNLWAPLFTTKAKGMGFGLPICRRIIEAHGGTVQVKTVLGKGTTFTVSVPLRKTEGGEKVWVRLPESLSLTTTRT